MVAKYRPFERGIPVNDTITRVIKRIESHAFNETFLNFINEIRTQQGRKVIAIDGVEPASRLDFVAEKILGLGQITFEMRCYSAVGNSQAVILG